MVVVFTEEAMLARQFGPRRPGRTDPAVVAPGAIAERSTSLPSGLDADMAIQSSTDSDGQRQTRWSSRVCEVVRQ